MEFVVENYLWFLIGAIVLLMIIIGYFAERTNFGKIPLNNKKRQEEAIDENTEVQNMKEDKSETNEEIKLDQIGIADALAPEENLAVSEGIDAPLSNNEMLEEDLNVPFGDVVPEEVHESTLESSNVEEVQTVPEAVEETEENVVTDESEDDVWKF